ncbi:MAG: hypothetical protein AAGF11_12140 [Myxococcota bacterium]
MAVGLLVGCPLDTSGLGAGGDGADSGGRATTSFGSGDLSAVGTTTGSTGGSVPPEGSSTGDPSSSEETGEPEAWPEGPFGDPVVVSVINSGQTDDDPTLTADRLEIYFASNREGDEDLYVATRRSTNDDWSPAVPVPVVNEEGVRDNTPGISGDGLTLLFASERQDSLGDQDLYVSTRARRGQPWSMPVHVSSLSSDRRDIAPGLTVGREAVYWCSFGPGMGSSGDLDVWWAEVLRDGVTFQFGPAQPVPGLLNTNDDECASWLSPDRRTIVFDRSSGSAGFDLWMASRDEPDQGFGEPVPLDAIDREGINLDGSNDTDPWISPDGRVLYFTSSRGGSDDIYRAVR